jgi:hypothetical protein
MMTIALGILSIVAVMLVLWLLAAAIDLAEAINEEELP